MSKASELMSQYKKAIGQLKRAITTVEREGYEAYTQVPNLVKRPTEASIRKIKNLTDKVYEHSFKVSDTGEKEIRLIKRQQEKKVKSVKKELLQGEKILTKEAQKNYLSSIKGTIREDMYGEDFAILRGVLDTIMDSFFILKADRYEGSPYHDIQKYVEEYESKFVRWVNNATPETIREADKIIDWKKFMVQFYDSEGPGRGMEPFLEEMRKEIAKLQGIKVIDNNAYSSMSPEQRMIVE